jgi:MFS family permease
VSTTAARAETFETQIPARMDRLPWTRWHWLVVFALGTVWILDGLEVTIVGSIGAVLTSEETLAFSDAQIGLFGSIYVAGAVVGSLTFGYLTDRLGRKRLFFVTLAVYTIATAATAFAWDFWSFAAFRFLTGAGIGGEYAAINSAIDELIPARVRGWVDLAINGSYWLGTIAGACAALLLLDTSLIPAEYGWRVAFGVGATLGLLILVTRRLLPESPRWLMIHGREEEAEKIVRQIEAQVERDAGEELEEPEDTIEIHPRKSTGFGEIARTMVKDYPSRSVLGFSLMAAEAFFYNAVFFTYAIILSEFFDVDPGRVPLYLIPFALGNFLGPLLLGRLFDVVGRRTMIAGSYIVSGIGLAVIAYLFSQDFFGATSLTVAYSIVFFVASAGASAAYLTISEIFPLEIRAMAIAFFYAVATGAGGITGPVLFGALVGTKDPTMLAWGFVAAAVLMVVAGIVEAVIGVPAEQESLEDVAEPLSAEGGGKLESEEEDSGGDGPRPERTRERASGPPTRLQRDRRACRRVAQARGRADRERPGRPGAARPAFARPAPPRRALGPGPLPAGLAARGRLRPRAQGGARLRRRWARPARARALIPSPSPGALRLSDRMTCDCIRRPCTNDRRPPWRPRPRKKAGSRMRISSSSSTWSRTPTASS